jgi:hypothetical protein
MASLAWRAETVQGQIGPGTEFGILPEAWIPGEAPKFPPVKTKELSEVPEVTL